MDIKTVASSSHTRQQSSSSSSQPRKKQLNKLRSVRVANLDRLRLSMKSRLNHDFVIPPHQAHQAQDDVDGDVQESLKHGAETPNYTKDTNSSSARKGSSSSLHPTTGDAASSAQLKSFQKIKRMSSLKRLKKTPSFRRTTRVSGKGGTRIHPSQELVTGRMSNLGPRHPAFQEDHCETSSSSTCGEGAQVAKTMAKSRSIKLTRITSVRLSRRLSKSRLGPTSLFSPTAETDGEIPFDDRVSSDSQASIVKQEENSPVNTPRLRALKTLSKSPSLRSRRRVEKKGSRNATRTRFDQATCSSALRSNKGVVGVADLVSRETEPEEHPMLHVCPYSYCSVHGNKRAGLPSLKGFVAAKRRTLKKQKSKRVTQKYTTRSEISEDTEESREMVCEGEDSGMTDIREETCQEGGNDGMKAYTEVLAKMREMQSLRSIHDVDPKEANSSMGDETEENVSQIDDISMPIMISLRPEMLRESPSGRHVSEPAGARQQTEDSNELSDKSLATHPQVESGDNANNSLLGRQNSPNMWDLIFSRYVQPRNEQLDEVAEKEQGGPDTTDSSPRHEKKHDLDMADEDENKEENEDEDADKENADEENLELNQEEAIQLVQEAVNELLRLHEDSADSRPVTPVQRVSHGPESSDSTPLNTVIGNFERTNEEEEKGARLKSEEVDAHTTRALQKAESKEGKPLERQASKGLAKLRKMIITAKSIKTMEKLMRIKSRKPRNLSSVASSGTNKALLRHRSMKSKRSAEELMLDYALRQVIAKLDPAQQQRVTLLIEAFETMSPELGGKGLRANPRRLQIASNAASQSICERDGGACVMLHPGPSMLSGQSIEEPDGTTSHSDANDSMGLLASSGDRHHGELKTSIRAAPVSYGFPQEHCNENIMKSSKESHEEVLSGGDARAVESLVTCEMGSREYDRSDEVSHMTSDFLKSAHRVCRSSVDDRQISLPSNQGNGLEKQDSQQSWGSEILGVQSKTAEGINEALEISRQYSLEGSEVSSVNGEETGLQFDKQKFTNVWNMVYQHFVASEPSESENKQDLDSAEKEHGSRIIERSDSGTSQKGLNQADAVQLVQEAIDELLRLQGQLSDQQPIRAQSLQIRESNGEKINAMEPSRIRDPKDLYTRSELDGMQTEPEELESKEQNPVQAKPSKAYGKLRSLMVSTKFIKTMQKLRKISPKRGQNLSSMADSGPERVYLRHLSMDGRRNSEEWMLDYALQQVLSKMDPAQQRRVAMLTRVFESVNPEIQEINAEPQSSNMQTANSVNLKDNKEDIIPEGHEGLRMTETKVQQLEDNLHALAERSSDAEHSILPSGEDPVDGVTTLDSNRELYKDSIEFKGINLHLHSTDGSTDGCPVCYPEGALTIGGEGVNSSTEQELHKLQSSNKEAEQRNNIEVTQAKLEATDYSNIWNLIYQQVKSRTAEDIDGQTEVAATKETGRESKSTHHVVLELTQSDVMKVVQEALEGILKQSHLDQKTPSKQDEDNSERINNFNNERGSMESSREVRFNRGTNTGVEEDDKVPDANQSLRKAVRPYSRWKRALICSKFVTAMEKMQKFHPQRRLNSATGSDQEPEVVNLRRCQLDDRSLGEEWMFDHALQQVIAKLAPVQQKRVATLVKAFETVAPTAQEETSKQSCGWSSEPSNVVSTNRNEERRDNTDGHVPVDRTLQENDEVMSSRSHNKGEESEAGGKLKFGNSWKSRETELVDVLKKQKSIRSMVMSDAIKPQPEKNAEQDVVKNPHTINGSIKDLSKPEDLEDDNSTKEMRDTLPGEQKYTSMWKLIRKHLNASTAQIMEEQIPEKMDADNMPLEKKIDSCQSSVESHQIEADEVRVKDSMNINVQQQEAIKMVQEAVDEMLHSQEPARGDQSTASPTPNQAGCNTPYDETVEMPEGERRHEKLTRSYSAMSKIILCNKFIRAMEKMKKTRSRRRWSLPRQNSLDAETVTLRPQSTNEKNYDDWMLDNALQQVIGKLGPAQKKKVSSLVDAFEKFTPSFDTRANPRPKAVAW